MIGALALSIVLALCIGSPEPIYFALPLALIATDYSASQAFSPKVQALVRALQILTTAALPFSFIGFVVLRMVVSIIILMLAIRTKSYADEATIAKMVTPQWGKSSVVLLSSATYFLPLILIGNLGLASAKTGYLVYAIGATGLLRIIDYEIKHALSGEQVDLSTVYLIGLAVVAVAFTAVSIVYDVRYLAMLLTLPILLYLRFLMRRISWH